MRLRLPRTRSTRIRLAMLGGILTFGLLSPFALPPIHQPEIAQSRPAVHYRPVKALTSIPVLPSETRAKLQASLPIVPTMVAVEAAPQPLRRVLQVKRGDTLLDLLVEEGISRADAHQAIAALKTVYNPRALRPGQELTITFGPVASEQAEDLERHFFGLSVPMDYRTLASVERLGGGTFEAKQVDRALVQTIVRVGSKIDSSLFVAGLDAGVPAPVMVDLIRLFSFDVDFQRDIRKGDKFEILLQRYFDEVERPVHSGEILFGALTLRGEEFRIYRHAPVGGDPDYFNENGESVRKALLKTPIDGARLSSRYGKRKHPILGYTMMHRGIDFAAPRDTPIMAAGNGVVVKATRNGAYGKYVRIRHNSTYATAYAHLHAFGRGIKRGVRVKQGQVIGYVGSTGRSTGPHLHYELIVDSRQINPLRLKLPAGRKLAGAELAQFMESRQRIDQTLAELQDSELLARNQDQAN